MSYIRINITDQNQTVSGEVHGEGGRTGATLGPKEGDDHYLHRIATRVPWWQEHARGFCHRPYRRVRRGLA